MAILITVVVITAIAGVLALLLTFANSYIADYGSCKIKINGEKELLVQGGNTLLAALRENQIFIPSACGGKGSCAYCKVRVVKGGGPVLSTELPYLSVQERRDSIRLSCQCKVKEDLEIEIPEELFNVKEFRASVEVLEDLSPIIKLLRLRLLEPSEIQFKPGQYIQLKAPAYKGSPEEVYRAYSVASSIVEQHFVELIIGYVPGGICTTYIHQHLKVGDEVLLNGPYGDFYLQDSQREMVFVAVGTGMAPIRSMLYALEQGKSIRKGIYFFGARTQEDLILLEEMKGFEEKLDDFRFIPCLSRPKHEEGWTGEVGRVTDLIEKYIGDGENKEAYLCGSKAMIDSTVVLLKKKGVPEHLIYYDKFD